MKTDAQFNKIFSGYPQDCSLLFGLPDLGPCRFTSINLKEISRTVDGCMEPLDEAKPLRLLEFQMQSLKHITRRLGIERACVEIAWDPRPVEAYVIFATKSLDPEVEPWKNVVTSLYLDEAMEKLAKRDPAHFLVALFRPLLEPSDEVVEKMAALDYSLLADVVPPAASGTALPAIFLDWLAQRFSQHTSTQISKMIAQLTPIEQTALGRELIGIGMEKGLEKGLEKGVVRGVEEGMERLLLKQLSKRFGVLPEGIKNEVEALSADGLEAFSEDIFGMTSLADVQAWFRRR